MKRIYNTAIFRIWGALTALAMVMTISTLSFAQEKKSPENITITNLQKTLTIYPVPVTSTVHIRISPALRPEVDKLEIINLIGRKVAEQSVIDSNTTDVSFSNLNQYPSGIYMIIAKDKYGKIVKSVKMVIDK